MSERRIVVSIPRLPQDPAAPSTRWPMTATRSRALRGLKPTPTTHASSGPGKSPKRRATSRPRVSGTRLDRIPCWRHRDCIRWRTDGRDGRLQRRPGSCVGRALLGGPVALYPDFENPRTLTTDPVRKQEGIDRLVELCTDHPTRFYSLLGAAASASWHLISSAITRLDPVGSPGIGCSPGVLRPPAVQRCPAHAPRPRFRGAEQRSVERDTSRRPKKPSSPSRGAARPISAHDHLHKYLLHHPPTTLGPDPTASSRRRARTAGTWCRRLRQT